MSQPGVLSVSCTDRNNVAIRAAITFLQTAPFALTGLTATNSEAVAHDVTIVKGALSQVVSLPAGNTTISAAQLAAVGFSTLADVQGMSLAC